MVLFCHAMKMVVILSPPLPLSLYVSLSNVDGVFGLWCSVPVRPTDLDNSRQGPSLFASETDSMLSQISPKTSRGKKRQYINTL